MYSPRQHEPPVDPKKYDPNSNQWMREAMESRHTIEELRAHNDTLQRDVYGLVSIAFDPVELDPPRHIHYPGCHRQNSRINLIYECLGDLNIVDRVGDLMQKKIRNFQLAQHARQNPPPANAFANSPRQRKLSDAAKLDEGIICGSSTFHQTAAFSSSYEGQVARDTFNRRNMFETEEAQYRDKYDIFGNAKAPSPTSSSVSGGARRGDAIDNLLSSGGATAGGAGAGRHYTQQQPPPIATVATKPYGSR